MSATVLDLNRFKFKPEDKILVDVNVLLYLQSGKTHKYDRMWELARQQGNKLYFTSLSISEFVNRYVRTGYDQYLETHGYNRNNFDFKKQYQKTQHFLDLYDEVIDTIETEILPKMTILDYNNEDFQNLSQITEYMLDFNDAMYVKKALTEDFIIVTHDRDFFNLPYDIKIYTYLSK